jgi:stage III sporulation protein AD
MEIIQIIGVAFTATFIIVLLKQYKPEYAIHISIIAGTIIFGIILLKMSGIINLLETLSNKIGVDNQFYLILLKITGIAYLTEFASNVCKDSGETAIASKVELRRKSTNYSIINSDYWCSLRCNNQIATISR